jgi:hypothetical protein
MQRLSSIAALTALSFGGASWLGACPKVEPIPNELPRSWSLEEIAEATPPCATKSHVYVLAWKVMEDDRPLRVESCLALRVLDEDDGDGRWCLAHLYRHPSDKRPEWRLSSSHLRGGKKAGKFGLWISHYKCFKVRPTNKVIYASFSSEELNWSFKQPEGYGFVSCAVCEKNWEAVVGEKPTRFFGR